MTIDFFNVSTEQIQLSPSPVIGMAVLSKSLETAVTQGQGMVEMMEQSVNPNLGANIDIRV